MSYSDPIKAAVEYGSFGNKNLDKIEVDEEKKKEFQASSNLYFVEVTAGNIKIPVIVKTQLSNRIVSEQVFRDCLFVNEVCFYSKLLPFLSKIDASAYNFFPKYYYGCATFGKNINKDAVILEDLSTMGFKPSKLGRELDFDHITLILQTLGKIHALSYKSKKEHPEVFRRLLSDLKNETELVEDFVATSVCRAAMSYQGSSKDVSKLRDTCCKDPLQSFRDSMIPKEPFAVLCHGDLCSNNMLFLYNKHGKPEVLKLVDLQRCRYASPAIDLSLFLLYNTTTGTKTHWDYFLRVYHESLRTAYTDVAVPSFKEFMDDFTQHVFYGITACCYMFHVITLSSPHLNEYFLLDKEDKVKTLGTMGGEKASQLINEMFQLLLSKGYI
ncbi:uncharacterized protein [Rhodnius prolixus]|uniref:uncharacterized protein n=1 Tax=Rhodnius prolixus TaxID=13249 RepID=UPI003D189A11